MVSQNNKLGFLIIIAFVGSVAMGANDPWSPKIDPVLGNEKCPPYVLSEGMRLNSPKPPMTDHQDSIAGQAQLCRSILGEFPKEFDCSKGTELPVTNKSTGRQVIMDPDGKFYELQGQTKIPVDEPPQDSLWCAHPVVAPGFKSSVCAIGSRLIKEQVGPTVWVGFCRSNHHARRGDNFFSSMSVYGYNPKTGETCFFDYQPGQVAGKASRETRGLDMTHIPPPGSTGNDARAKELAKGWKPQSKFISNNSCMECHGNNGPIIRSPYVEAAQVDLPAEPTTAGTGFRVLGPVPSVFRPRPGLSAELLERQKAKYTPRSIVPKIMVNGKPQRDETCTGCHTITSNMGFLVSSAVGKSHGKQYTTGDPWMPPGINASNAAEVAKAQEAADRILYCIEHPEDSEKCYPSEAVLTACPEPDVLPNSNLVATSGESIEDKLFTKKISFKWEYKDKYNTESGVANRDDIRFDITLTGSDGSKCTFQDVSPGPNGKGQFQLPALSGITYTARVTTKRHCSDGSGIKSAPAAAIVVKRTAGGSSEDATETTPHALENIPLEQH